MGRTYGTAWDLRQVFLILVSSLGSWMTLSRACLDLLGDCIGSPLDLGILHECFVASILLLHRLSARSGRSGLSRLLFVDAGCEDHHLCGRQVIHRCVCHGVLHIEGGLLLLQVLRVNWLESLSNIDHFPGITLDFFL